MEKTRLGNVSVYTYIHIYTLEGLFRRHNSISVFGPARVSGVTRARDHTHIHALVYQFPVRARAARGDKTTRACGRIYCTQSARERMEEREMGNYRPSRCALSVISPTKMWDELFFDAFVKRFKVLFVITI